MRRRSRISASTPRRRIPRFRRQERAARGREVPTCQNSLSRTWATASPPATCSTCWSRSATCSPSISRSSSSRPTRRRSKCRRRSPARVTDMHVKAGDKVKPGQLVLVVDDGWRGRRCRSRGAAAGAPRRLQPPRPRKRALARARRPRPRPQGRSRRSGDSPTDRGRMSVAADADDAAERQRQGAGRSPPAVRPRRPPTADPWRRPRRRCAAWRGSSASTSSRCPAPVPAAASARRRQGLHQARHVEPGRRRPGGRGDAVGRLGGPARLLEVGRDRAQADARHPPQDRRAPVARVEHDSARHAVRQGRHHRSSSRCARSTAPRSRRRAAS